LSGVVDGLCGIGGVDVEFACCVGYELHEVDCAGVVDCVWVEVGFGLGYGV